MKTDARKTSFGFTATAAATLLVIAALPQIDLPQGFPQLDDLSPESLGVHEHPEHEGNTTVYGWWSNLQPHHVPPRDQDSSVILRWRIGNLSSGEEWAPQTIYLNGNPGGAHRLTWITFK